MHPQGEADNSAGQEFRGADGAELLAFAWYDDTARLPELSEAEARDTAEPAGRITYRRHLRGKSIVSGVEGSGRLFYTVTIRDADHLAKAHLRYPRERSAHYRPVAERLARCFGFSPRR